MSRITNQDVYDIGSQIVATIDYDVWKSVFLNNEEDTDVDMEIYNMITKFLATFDITVDESEEILRDSD